MQTTIIQYTKEGMLRHLSQRIGAKYLSSDNLLVGNYTTGEILKCANHAEYLNYVSCCDLSSSIGMIQKTIDAMPHPIYKGYELVDGKRVKKVVGYTSGGLMAQIAELERLKAKNEKTMEKIQPGSSDISSLKPMLYHKHLEMPSIIAIEDAIRKISQINYELNKIYILRTSVMDRRHKARTQLEKLMKDFDAITRDMLVVVRKYNLRKYISSSIDNIQSPDTDPNEKEKLQKELDRLMKQFKLSSIHEAPDIVVNYVSPSHNTPIPTKGDRDYRKCKPYTYLAKSGRKYYSIDVIKINRLIPQISSAHNTIEILLNQINELTEKSSQLNADIDSHEETMKKIVRGTPMERANIDRSTTLDSLKEYRKKYIHIEDEVDTYYLTVKQQLSLKRARGLRDNKISRIEALNHKIIQAQHRIQEKRDGIDSSFMEDAIRFAHDIYYIAYADRIASYTSMDVKYDAYEKTYIGRMAFFIKCASTSNVSIDAALNEIGNRPDASIKFINALSNSGIDKTIYITMHKDDINNLTEYAQKNKKHISAKIVKFDKEYTVQDFISSIRGEKQ